MASAKTVAQKPAGNFRPLSSLGHVWLPAPVLAVACFAVRSFSALKKETLTLTAASATREYDRAFLIVLLFIANLLSYLARASDRVRGSAFDHELLRV